MSSLHTINKKCLVNTCRQFLQPGDSVLFIEDAVYISMDLPALNSLPISIDLYSLGEDLAARGLSGSTQHRISVINYPGFVDLCCKHSKVINWF